MPIYWRVVAGFSCFAAVLTTVSTVYWLAVLLVPTAGIVGDFLQELLAETDAGRTRARKWLAISLTLTLVGSYCNLAPFLVPGIVGVLGLLFSHIARELEVLRAS